MLTTAVARHYSFSIKKCGENGCAICKPVRMPKVVFQTLWHLPDATMDNNDHYLSFEEVEDICKGSSFTPQCKEGKSSSIHPYQDMYRMSVSWFSVKSATYGGYCIPRESWLHQRSRDVSYSCGATHFMNLIFRTDLHVFMSFSITARIQLSHSTTQQGSIPPVSTVLVSCRTLNTSENYSMCGSCQDKELIKLR